MFLDMKWTCDLNANVLGHSEAAAMEALASQYGWKAAAVSEKDILYGDLQKHCKQRDKQDTSAIRRRSGDSTQATSQKVPRHLQIMTRIDVVLDEFHDNGRTLKYDKHSGKADGECGEHYDIVSVVPMSERALQACSAGTVDCDIISFEMHKKLPFKLKTNVLQKIMDRGVFFEVRKDCARTIMFNNLLLCLLFENNKRCMKTTIRTMSMPLIASSCFPSMNEYAQHRFHTQMLFVGRSHDANSSATQKLL